MTFVTKVQQNETTSDTSPSIVEKVKVNFVAKVNSGSLLNVVPSGAMLVPTRSIDEIVTSYTETIVGMLTTTSITTTTTRTTTKTTTTTLTTTTITENTTKSVTAEITEGTQAQTDEIATEKNNKMPTTIELIINEIETTRGKETLEISTALEQVITERFNTGATEIPTPFQQVTTGMTSAIESITNEITNTIPTILESITTEKLNTLELLTTEILTTYMYLL